MPSSDDTSEPQAPPSPPSNDGDSEPMVTGAPLTDREQSRVDSWRNEGWNTDFLIRTVSYESIFSGGVPRDGIPPIETPLFSQISESPDYLMEDEPMIVIENNGEAKAYSLNILTRHEIVNDEIGGLKISVTFCPLCNSAIVFQRVVNGTELTFGVSGNLRNSDLVMYDRQTHSWWQQLTGEAIAGKHAAGPVVLDVFPSSILPLREFRTRYPDGLVLLRDPTYRGSYNRPFYSGYDELSSVRPFLFTGELDDRLPPTERVLAIQANGESIAYAWEYLRENIAIHGEVGGIPFVTFFDDGTLSSFPDSRNNPRVAGSSVAFSPEVDGMSLTFTVTNRGIEDEETGSLWSSSGLAVEGQLEGATLETVPHGNHFWFAWYAFFPDAPLITSDASPEI